ncbi:sensor histidine kinase [Cellulomonas shaoxiangyii]|uniref:Sensor histidine kinase n=1 Tax=Cellulomonas shaoxiangyii TaxID=2566013 RepID=A0A4P7SFV5_9CELL|nr:sensor histidine kinase [Cellulomonas shaoxiangyii]QCB92882.1 sensor histidine kinase [Cellulomonas shaoxiangyii]TGY81337.1 sensor histidine kinase [Cellulomonas shaoxiangyii]
MSEQSPAAPAPDAVPGTAGTAPGPHGRELERHGFWVRTLRTWDAVFVAMLGVYTVAVLVDSMPPARQTVALLLVVLLAAAYVLLGRQGALRGAPRLTDAYLVVLTAVAVAQVALGGLGTALLFVVFSHIWFFSRRRVAGIAWSSAVTVGITVAAAWRVGADADGVAVIAGEFGVALLFAIVLGLWITQVAEQSEERAHLLEELRAAQDELGASHHAAGVLAERARLAGEIHDTLAQGFTSVVMLAQAASAELERDRVAQARTRLGHIEDVARDNLAEARALVAAFAPPGLDDGGLSAALVRLAHRFRDETGVRVLVEDTTGGAVGREQEVVLLRAAQESLANVRKHAQASTVTLRLARTGGDVVLEVADDGRGTTGAPEGAGLRGMRARVDAAGGTLDVSGAPGGGTRVLLRVPVPPDDDLDAPPPDPSTPDAPAVHDPQEHP